MAYLTLFISAFAAASLLPLQSEAVLIGLLLQDQNLVWLLLLSASLGNILGSCLNWYLGVKVEQFKHKSWFPFSQEKMNKAGRMYHRYGYWSLLMSWMPVIGDPITLIAGLMRENFLRFLMMVSIAKTGRYLFLYWVIMDLF